MRHARLLVLLVVVVVVVASSAGCSGNGPGGEPFSYVITPALVPAVQQLDSEAGTPRPVGAYEDSLGVRSDFVTDEVVIEPRSQAELDDFLARYDGVVVADDRVPEPPAGLGVTLAPEDTVAHGYTVRVGTLPSLDSLEREAGTRGMRGAYRFSSDDAARLITLTTLERNRDLLVAPNWVMTGDAMLHSTEEHPLSGGGFRNAFDFNDFRGRTFGDGSRSTVWAAWQFMNARGFTPASVPLAIIDGGFWLDGAGHPLSDTAGLGSDLPYSPVQYDFQGDDYIADGVSPTRCSGGGVCNWHGNNSASVACGFIDNQKATAGTGGQVADPVLFKLQTTMDQVKRAVRTLVPWGVKVANMSFGGPCNEDCRDYRGDENYYDPFQQAFDAGVVLVAAAGNSTQDVDATQTQPCMIGGVICVGALDNDKNTAIGYSNFGAGVDIWAPTDIPTMPNGDNPGALATGGGTSASSPFVAGVVAMMKAVNPSLNSDAVALILRNTAWNTGANRSADPKVQGVGYLDALAAVRAAAGALPADSLEPDDSAAAARTILAGNTYYDLTVRLGGPDFYRFTLDDYSHVTIGLEYMSGLGPIYMSVTPETAPGDPSSATTLRTNEGYSESAIMAPGTYRVQLLAYADTNYHLTFGVSLGALTPDGFETNDTLGAPALPADGEYEVNLHTDADVDHYQFDVPSDLDTFAPKFAFAVARSDYPVTVQLYDHATASVRSTFTDRQGSFTLDAADAGKTFTAIVSGGHTRYEMSLTRMIDPSALAPWVDFDPFWWKDFVGSWWNGVIEGADDWLIVQGGITDPQAIGVFTPGVTLELFGADGTSLSASEAADSGQGTYQRMSVGGLMQPGETYFIRVSRQDGIFVDGATSFPAVAYSLFTE